MTAAAAPEVVFFGYWSGRLPPITALHFRSFLHHHPGARYELWLDEDQHSTLAPELGWLEQHPRVAVRPFSLDVLIERHVSARPLAAYDRFARLRRLGRALHRRMAPPWARRRAWDHALFGLTYRHSSRLFHGFTCDKTYRGDVARWLLPMIHYDGPALYADLDVCFLSDLRDLCAGAGWVYRWEEFAFANNALLFIPGPPCSAAVVRKANEIETYRPWILLSDDLCAELALRVLPARLFDPLWDPSSLLQGDPQRLFCAREQAAQDLQALLHERHRAIHWHNHWRTVPADTSLYVALLAAFGEPQ